MANRKHSGRQRGTALFLGTLSLIFIVPMVGLVIDVGILYSAKSRMQAAVDGAALAAARSLNVGQTTDYQATSAKQNAVNWFYANFPTGNWSTSNTQMDTTDTHVHVYDDPTNANLRRVDVTATTTVPTWFMRWFNINSTTLTSVGNASRRDVVMMVVLDRSYSMVQSGSCNNLKSAAKTFVGQFAAGRDRIGLASFAGEVLVQSAPSTSFRTNLGYYVDASHSGNGEIDNIVCDGNTNTSQAISIAYNELWKMNLPGALNILLLETDGLPNSATVNFWDSANPATGGLANASNCTDINNHKMSTAAPNKGFQTAAVLPQWSTRVPFCGGAGQAACGTNNSYLSGNPQTTPGGTGGASYSAGIVGVVGSNDPADGAAAFYVLQKPYTGVMPAGGGFNPPYIAAATAPGCGFTGSHGSVADFAWFPPTDVYGNKLKPASAYKAVTLAGDGIHVANTGWTNWHNGAINAADNAAYNARVGATLPAPNAGTNLSVLIDVIGLGSGIDHILLQRIANDPNGDNFSGTSAYSACASEAGCVTYGSPQQQGMYVFSTDKSDLQQAFLSISSQILRLSR